MDKQEPGKVLTGPEMIELGAEVFRREPKASSDRVYDALEREHGAAALGVSRASWVSVYARQARRAAGVEAPNVAARNKARAKKKHKPAADHPWKQRARAEVAEAKASTPLEDQEVQDEVATEQPSEAERPGEATDSSAGAELAEPEASPASRESDGRKVLELSCPGTGFLRATEARDGGWRVTYEGHADGSLLDDLVRALALAVTNGGRAA